MTFSYRSSTFKIISLGIQDNFQVDRSTSAYGEEENSGINWN